MCLENVSDTMGGETTIPTANGYVRLRSPSKRHGIPLQDGYLTHEALRALGAMERITAFTAWRPRLPLVRDGSQLCTVRPVSDLSAPHYYCTNYRVEKLGEWVRKAREGMRDQGAVAKSSTRWRRRRFSMKCPHTCSTLTKNLWRRFGSQKALST